MPKTRKKFAIMASEKAVGAPRVSSLKNPLPIRGPEKLFKPVKTFRRRTPGANPVLKPVRKAQFKIPHSSPPVRRLERGASLSRNTPVPPSKPATTPRDDSFNIVNLSKSFQPAARALRTSSSQGETIASPIPQMKRFSGEFFKDYPQAPSPAASHYKEKMSPPKTAAVKKFSPVDLKAELLDNQPVPGIETSGEFGLKTFRGVGPAPGIESRTPGNPVAVVGNRPVIAVSGTPVSSPATSARLFQMAAIPADFSEEILNRDEETGVPTKAAGLDGGVNEVSDELLGKIKEGFSSRVWSKIEKFKYYPRIARKRGFEGKSTVAFTLGKRGELLEISIKNPSPFKLLDEAALEVVKLASPYPPIPETLNMKSIRLTAPIFFTLEEQ